MWPYRPLLNYDCSLTDEKYVFNRRSKFKENSARLSHECISKKRPVVKNPSRPNFMMKIYIVKPTFPRDISKKKKERKKTLQYTKQNLWEAGFMNKIKIIIIRIHASQSGHSNLKLSTKNLYLIFNNTRLNCIFISSAYLHIRGSR